MCIIYGLFKLKDTRRKENRWAVTSINNFRNLIWSKLRSINNSDLLLYEGHLESKERFAIKKYLLIIGKKKNMQVLSHTFTYFST